MSDIVIKVENLFKEYRLGSISHGTLSRDLQSWWARFRLKDDPNSKLTLNRGSLETKDSFLAIDNVSFDVKQGEVIGIIGRNGAGKSTLLKILSRVTSPTKGTVKLKGRVASLLEVGTGFHPELTGRENIYLNGALMGMSKTEISRKFDEIVDFAETEKFIDTPVKRYSSGMYVRLAFAVAAHLEPEILIIDEVLAVGDAKFQKKCLGKMQAVGSEGRTVLFVSHNMNAIEQLCEKAILLQDGSMIENSHDMRHVIGLYLQNNSDSERTSWVKTDDVWCQYFTPTKVYITNKSNEIISNIISNTERITVNIEGHIGEYDPALQVGYALYDEENVLVFWSIFNDSQESDWPKVSSGRLRFYSTLPARYLNEGSYRIEIISALYYREWINQPGINSPSINFKIVGGLSDSPYWLVRRPGVLAPVLGWKTSII